MIVVKSWSREVIAKYPNKFKYLGYLYGSMTHTYKGWFLFGIIPLFITRQTSYNR